jgi:hypothetical protein
MSAVRVNYVMVCDDVRHEANGKELLIGVYNDSIIAKGAPLRFPTFHIRLSLYLSNETPKPFSFTLQDPDDKALMHVENRLPETISKEQTILDFAAYGIVLEKTGRYSIRFGVGDEKETEIGAFTFRFPETDEERQRMSS